MAFGLIILAAIPAYLAAGTTLFMGAGWMMALMVLVGTGLAGTLILATLRAILSATPTNAPRLSLT